MARRVYFEGYEEGGVMEGPGGGSYGQQQHHNNHHHHHQQQQQQQQQQPKPQHWAHGPVGGDRLPPSIPREEYDAPLVEVGPAVGGGGGGFQRPQPQRVRALVEFGVGGDLL